jgi:hypothetical protein
MTKKNTDQKEQELTTEPVAREVEADMPDPNLGTFNLVFNGSTWQSNSNMSTYLQVGVLRSVIHRLEQIQLQPPSRQAPAVEPADEAQEQENVDD